MMHFEKKVGDEIKVLLNCLTDWWEKIERERGVEKIVINVKDDRRGGRENNLRGDRESKMKWQVF